MEHVHKDLSERHSHHAISNRLFQLLLGAELVGVSALLLAAVGRSGRETGVALSADHLVAVVLGGEGLERWLDDTTTETEDQVEGRLLFSVLALVLLLMLSMCEVERSREISCLLGLC